MNILVGLSNNINSRELDIACDFIRARPPATNIVGIISMKNTACGLLISRRIRIKHNAHNDPTKFILISVRSGIRLHSSPTAFGTSSLFPEAEGLSSHASLEIFRKT